MHFMTETQAASERHFICFLQNKSAAHLKNNLRIRRQFFHSSSLHHIISGNLTGPRGSAAERNTKLRSCMSKCHRFPDSFVCFECCRGLLLHLHDSHPDGNKTWRRYRYVVSCFNIPGGRFCVYGPKKNPPTSKCLRCLIGFWLSIIHIHTEASPRPPRKQRPPRSCKSFNCRGLESGFSGLGEVSRSSAFCFPPCGFHYLAGEARLDRLEDPGGRQ